MQSILKNPKIKIPLKKVDLSDEKSNNENYSKFQKKVSFHEKDRNKKIPQTLDFDQTSEATMSTLA